jgi:endonuclease YncB( thermonuclease family)
MSIPPVTVCLADTIPYTPPFTHGRVLDVKTGYTMTLAAYQNSKIPYRFSVRLRGVDCPRMGSRSEGERRIATKARSTVEAMILGSVVELRFASFDRYGRVMATVYTCTGVHLSDWLLCQRLAVRRHDVHPRCWLLYHKTGNREETEQKRRCVVDMVSQLRTDCFFFVYILCFIVHASHPTLPCRLCTTKPWDPGMHWWRVYTGWHCLRLPVLFFRV